MESWILRSALGTPVDPYLTAASALARSARAGCAAMMIHYTRPSGTMPLVEEAGAIARAASDVGIRIAFALAVRDRNPVVYGDEEPVLSGLSTEDRSTIEQMFVRAPMSPKAYVELTDAIAAAIAGPKVDVQLGPAGVQWCSKPLLEAVAENSAQTGRRIHMHLLETIYQRAWADQHFPDGIVRYLRDIGFLSERLTLAHCIHARPDEIEMIAASGARIVTNFSSNLHLRSGLAPIAAAHKCGCAIAVGVDGLALDEDDDVLREMRLVQMMHGGLGFQRTWTASEFLALAIANGRKATGAPGTGALMSGAPADFVTVDLDRLDRDQIMPVDPIDLLFARGNASLVRDVVVDGRHIVSEGRCTGVDLPAIERGTARDLPRERQASSPACSAPGRRCRRRCRTGSKRSSIAGKALSASCRCGNSVMWNEIPLAQNPGKGFMFGNKILKRRPYRAAVGVWGSTRGRFGPVTRLFRSGA